jgi:hypothetical protein
VREHNTQANPQRAPGAGQPELGADHGATGVGT